MNTDYKDEYSFISEEDMMKVTQFRNEMNSALVKEKKVFMVTTPNKQNAAILETTQLTAGASTVIDGWRITHLPTAENNASEIRSLVPTIVMSPPIDNWPVYPSVSSDRNK